MAWRVLIIGAGPAGAIAGLILARRGLAVTILEQHAGRRDKVCGECLSSLGIGVLEELGLAGSIHQRFCPVILRRARLYPIDSPAVDLPLPAEMWGISRAELDDFLLSAAADSGARVIRPARCERLESSPVGVTARLRELTTGNHQAIAPDMVVLADGKGALLPGRPPATGDLGMKSHWVGLDTSDDAIELFGVAGHYGGIAPVEGGRCNISFSVPAERVRAFGGNLDDLFTAIARENAHLAARLRGGRRIGPWRASPLPRFGLGSGWPDRVIPVGNAAAAIEPIGGEGMGLAMRSAQLAADAIASASRSDGRVDGTGLRRAYRSLWNWRRMACRAFAQVLSRPSMASTAATLVDASPQVGRLALRLVGK